MKQQIPDIVRVTLKKLIYYPISTILCWVLNSITELYYLVNRGTGDRTNDVWFRIYVASIAIALLEGFFNTIVFFTMNPNVRYMWLSLFQRDVDALQRASDHATERGTKSARSSSSIWRVSQPQMLERVVENEMHVNQDMRDSYQPSHDSTLISSGENTGQGSSDCKPHLASMRAPLGRLSIEHVDESNSKYMHTARYVDDELESAVNPVAVVVPEVANNISHSFVPSSSSKFEDGGL